MGTTNIEHFLGSLASWTMLGLSLLLGGLGTWLLARSATVTPYADQAVPLLNLATVTATTGLLVLLARHLSPRRAPVRFALAGVLVVAIVGTLPLRAQVGSWKQSSFSDGSPAVALSWNAVDRNTHTVRDIDGVAVVRSIDFTPPLRLATSGTAAAACVPLDEALTGASLDGPGKTRSPDHCGARPAP